MSQDRSTAANPLAGHPPAPDQFKDDEPEGENPNASSHVENDPEWKKRPEQYPGANSSKPTT